jgi:hypothetical protein
MPSAAALGIGPDQAPRPDWPPAGPPHSAAELIERFVTDLFAWASSPAGPMPGGTAMLDRTEVRVFAASWLATGRPPVEPNAARPASPHAPWEVCTCEPRPAPHLNGGGHCAARAPQPKTDKLTPGMVQAVAELEQLVGPR